MGLQEKGIINIKSDTFCIDSTSIKVHPDANGYLKKSGKQAIGRSKGGLTTKIHMIVCSYRDVLIFSLSSGASHDSQEGLKLVDKLKKTDTAVYFLMDRAYEGECMGNKVESLNYISVVPPKSNRKNPWNYDRIKYKERTVIERMFLRLKRFRKINTRYDKIDEIFIGFIYFAIIVDKICVNTL